MINLIRLSNSLRAQADEYGDKAKAPGGGELDLVMYGTASMVLYALVIALNDSIRPEPNNLDYATIRDRKEPE